MTIIKTAIPFPTDPNAYVSPKRPINLFPEPFDPDTAYRRESWNDGKSVSLKGGEVVWSDTGIRYTPASTDVDATDWVAFSLVVVPLASVLGDVPEGWSPS